MHGRERQAAPMTAVERRCADRALPIPGPEVAARACPICGCVYLDAAPGIDAHLVVFGHAPTAGPG